MRTCQRNILIPIRFLGLVEYKKTCDFAVIWYSKCWEKNNWQNVENQKRKITSLENDFFNIAKFQNIFLCRIIKKYKYEKDYFWILFLYYIKNILKFGHVQKVNFCFILYLFRNIFSQKVRGQKCKNHNFSILGHSSYMLFI